jgi:hypothetical protein
MYYKVKDCCKNWMGYSECVKQLGCEIDEFSQAVVDMKYFECGKSLIIFIFDYSRYLII